MCTSLLMTAQDGSHLFSRTMDWHDPGARPIFIPRNHLWHSLYDGKGHAGKYAILGVGFAHKKHVDVSDGVNEAGLSVQKLTFQNATNYEPTRSDDFLQLAPFEFVLWALGQAGSVAELLALLPKVQLMTAEEADVNYGPSELHFAATDRTGRFVVIEPSRMPMVVIDNPLNVMTNAVDFSREVDRLQDYLQIDGDWHTLPFNQNRISTGKFTGLKPAPSSFTPSARFVRTMINKERLDPFADERSGVVAAWHVLNNVTVPAQHERSHTYTVYRSAVGLESRNLFFQSYDDLTVTRIDFPDGFETRTEVMTYSLTRDDGEAMGPLQR
jgi:choloylglycine hydrolase